MTINLMVIPLIEDKMRKYISYMLSVILDFHSGDVIISHRPAQTARLSSLAKTQQTLSDIFFTNLLDFRVI